MSNIRKSSYARGGIRCVEYVNKEGVLHREDGPAKVGWYECGNKGSEVYYINGVLHREDGPAEIQYYQSGTIGLEVWYKNGVRHREDGPAWILYNSDGRLCNADFFLEGNRRAFWKVYENTSPEAQKILLRDWIHYV
jgi:antitoxin component YwqK of YwqJK toxin-antitoxin module